MKPLLSRYTALFRNNDSGRLLRSHLSDFFRGKIPFRPKNSSTGLTAVITTCEVNQHHGTGVLVKRIVADTPKVLSIRSMDLYKGEHELGDVSLCLSLQDLSRDEVTKRVVRSVRRRHTIKRIFSVPYRSEDLIAAIALHDHCGAPLATHIMDDQNICANNIPDELMEEYLGKCSLRLVTHQELRDAYESKYGYKFWLLPSLVADRLISDSLKPSGMPATSPDTGALIGSLANEHYFDLLCATIGEADVHLDWYSGSIDWYRKTAYTRLRDNPDEARLRGISISGLLSEEDLARALKTYNYLIVPTGTLDDHDDNPRLWRVIFGLATANIPIIALGSEETSVARLIRQFNVGAVSAYDGTNLRRAVERLTDIESQREMRGNAARIAARFSEKGVNHWLWESIDLGRPSDFRFEEMLSFKPDQHGTTPPAQTLEDLKTSEEVLSFCLPERLLFGYDGHIVDINHTDYIDLVSGWGSNILGHGYRRVANAVAKQAFKYSNLGMVGSEWQRLYDLLTRLIPCAEAIHLVKNGSDATAAAVRLARSATGRDKIIHRGYHGVQDWYMASLQCPGVPAAHRSGIISLTDLDTESVRKAFAAHPDEIACLIIDPMVWPIPEKETMLAIRDIVHNEGALLVYDEVVSGFRLAPGGAQEVWGVLPDLACYGKAMANGLPLSVLVGRDEWMQHVPSINYGLTFSLEALSIVAAIETISEIVDQRVYRDLAQKGRLLKKAYEEICETCNIESALVGHDCRPELWFPEMNGFSPEYCRNFVNYELTRQRVCTYGTFNLCYTHTNNDIEVIISALENAIRKLTALIHPNEPGRT